MHFITAIIFFIFAAVQYNDADYYIWVPAYAIVGVVALVYKNGYRPIRVLLGLVLVYLLGLVVYIPDLISWLQEGLPSVTGSMQAESPFIEFVREFFGLFICLLALCFYWYRSRKPSQ